MMNTTEELKGFVLFVALNGKEVTVGYLLTQSIGMIMGLFSLVFNALVLDTLAKEQELTPHYLIICNLAVTDMLTGIVGLFWGAQQLIYYQVLEEHLLRLGATMALVQCSLFHIALITIDAYVKIVHPYRYLDSVTNRTIAVISGLIWIGSVLFGLLPIFGWRNATSLHTSMNTLSRSFLILNVILLCAPMVVASPFVVSLLRTARRHARAIESQNAEPRSMTLKSVKTTLIISLAYVFCVTPLVIAFLLIVAGLLDNLEDEQIEIMMALCSFPAFTNPILNVIIYARRLTPIKNRLKRIIGRNRTEPVRSITSTVTDDP